MKRITLTLVVLAALMISTQASAQGYRLAAGVRLSNTIPTLNNSITAKYFATDKTAIEGLVSFGSRFGIGALLEIHNPLNAGFSWFYGAGGYVGFEGGDTFIGPTGIVGLDYKFPSAPVNLSLDWKPELDIVPKVNFVPNAFALSARFTFK